MSDSLTLRLSSGPSQEKFFDCLRLGREHKTLDTVQFDVLRVMEDIVPNTQCKRTETQRICVQIEGIHHAPCNFRDGWVFWGRVKEVQVLSPTMNEPFIFMVPETRFVFGEWHTHCRAGRIIFSDKSFFENPLRNE